VQEDNDISLPNALLGWYLDNADGEEIIRICDRHKVAMGSCEFFMAMGIAQCWLETAVNLDQLTPENAQKLIENGITFLVQKLGAVPEKDIIPNGDGGFLVSDALMSKIGTLNRSKEYKPE
jgi:hypothetical protein